MDSLVERDPDRYIVYAREKRKLAAETPTVSVKDPPKYDPDSAVASLSLTIPSWASSIERVVDIDTLRGISDKAKPQLHTELLSLRDSIDLLLLALEEVAENE